MIVDREPDPREAKLPKWAQKEISLLRRNAALYQRKCAQMLGEPKDHWPAFGDHAEGLRGRSLPCSNVLFAKEGVEVRADKLSGGIYVYGHGKIAITPGASNTCYITSDRSYGA